MPVTCPAGHVSESTDYCDTCGAAIVSEPPGPALVTTEAPAPGTGPESGTISPCPNCGAPAGVDDAFCEVCGIDFATGELPTANVPVVQAGAAPGSGSASGAAPTSNGDLWVVVVEADRAFYEGNESPDVPLPFPEGRGAREVPLKTDEILIGRRSDSRGIFPDIDLGAPNDDPGVSRRHAILRRKPDGSWVLIDQNSTNGTRVSGAAAPLAAGEERPLLNGDQILVGAWTRITLKRT